MGNNDYVIILFYAKAIKKHFVLIPGHEKYLTRDFLMKKKRKYIFFKFVVLFSFNFEFRFVINEQKSHLQGLHKMPSKSIVS
jgi:hypothetical protein